MGSVFFLPETVSHQPCLLGCRNLLKYSQTSNSWNIWQTSHCFWCPRIPHSMLVSLAVCMHTPVCWNSIPTVKDKVAFSVDMITLNTCIFDKQVSRQLCLKAASSRKRLYCCTLPCSLVLCWQSKGRSQQPRLFAVLLPPRQFLSSACLVLLKFSDAVNTNKCYYCYYCYYVTIFSGATNYMEKARLASVPHKPC